MAQTIVRNIDDEIAERFKAKAKAQGKSAEQLLREIMAREVRPTTAEILRELDAIRATTGDKAAIDPVAIMRADRDTDHGRL